MEQTPVSWARLPTSPENNGRSVVLPSEGNEVRQDGQQGVGTHHMTVEGGEPVPRDPPEERVCRITEPQ